MIKLKILERKNYNGERYLGKRFKVKGIISGESKFLISCYRSDDKDIREYLIDYCDGSKLGACYDETYLDSLFGSGEWVLID